MTYSLEATDIFRSATRNTPCVAVTSVDTVALGATVSLLPSVSTSSDTPNTLPRTTMSLFAAVNVAGSTSVELSGTTSVPVPSPLMAWMETVE